MWYVVGQEPVPRSTSCAEDILPGSRSADTIGRLGGLGGCGWQSGRFERAPGQGLRRRTLVMGQCVMGGLEAEATLSQMCGFGSSWP